MELPELLTKFKAIEEKREKLTKDLDVIIKELDELYTTAWNDGFVWEPTEKKWYKEVN